MQAAIPWATFGTAAPAAPPCSVAAGGAVVLTTVAAPTSATTSNGVLFRISAPSIDGSHFHPSALQPLATTDRPMLQTTGVIAAASPRSIRAGSRMPAAAGQAHTSRNAQEDDRHA